MEQTDIDKKTFAEELSKLIPKVNDEAFIPAAKIEISDPPVEQKPTPAAAKPALETPSAKGGKKAKSQFVDKIIELLEKSGKLDAEKDVVRKRLNRKTVAELEAQLAKLTFDLTTEIKKIEVEEQSKKLEKEKIELEESEDEDSKKKYFVDVLFMINSVGARSLEEVSLYAQKNYPDYVRSNLSGYSDNLQKNKEELKTALRGVVEEHYESMKTYLSPMSLVLMINIMSAQGAYVSNLQKKEKIQN